MDGQRHKLTESKAGDLSQTSEEELQSLPGSSLFEKNYYFVPYPPVHGFVGREDVLQDIDNLFTSGSRAVVLVGLGGLGKTQVALEYCHRAKTSCKFQGIYWINADSTTKAEESIRNIVRRVNLAIDAKDDDTAGFLLKTLFEKLKGPQLLVFDNCCINKQIMSDFLSLAENENILITSREQDWEPIVEPSAKINLLNLGEDSAVELLLRGIDIKERTDELQEARRIVAFLEGLPLAIVQAASFIRTRKIRLDQFLAYFELQREKVIKSRMSSSTQYQHSLATVWNTSFERLQREHKDLLNLLSFFDSGEISEQLFSTYCRAVVKKFGPTYPVQYLKPFVYQGRWDGDEFRDVIRNIANRSLIRCSQTNDGFSHISLHRVVQAALQERLSLEERQLHLFVTANIIAAFTQESNAAGSFTLAEKKSVLPHIRRYKENRKFCQPRCDYPSDALFGTIFKIETVFATFLEEYGYYRDAEELLCELLLNIQNDSQIEAIIQVNIQLASVMAQQGKFMEANKIYRIALEFSTKINGPDHLDTISILIKLGSLLNLNGYYQEAEIINRKASDSCKTGLGADHVLYLDFTRNLSLQLYNQGKYFEAIDSLNHVLRLQEESVGSQNPSSRATIRALANLYLHQRRFEDAEALARRAAEGSELNLGSEHPETLSNLQILASAYEGQNRDQEAELLTRRILHGRLNMLGRNHVDTIDSFENLARILDVQGQYGEALGLREVVANLNQGTGGKEWHSKFYTGDPDAQTIVESDTGLSSTMTLATHSGRDFCVLIFTEDPSLQTLFKDVSHKLNHDGDKFISLVERLLEKFCSEIKMPKENQKLNTAVRFIQRQTRWIAHEINEKFGIARNTHQPTLADIKKQKQEKIPVEQYLDGIDISALLQENQEAADILRPNDAKHTTRENRITKTGSDNLEKLHDSEILNGFEGISDKSDDSYASMDDDLNYPDFPEHRDLQNFLVTSDAFHNLRKNLRQIIKDQSLEELLHEHTQRSERYTLLEREIQIMIAHSILAFIFLLAVLLDPVPYLRKCGSIINISWIIDIVCGTGRLEAGTSRIEWVCKCGYRSYDDMAELQPGALAELTYELQALGMIKHATINDKTRGHFIHLMNHFSNCFIWIKRTYERRRYSAKSHPLIAPDTVNMEMQSQDPGPEPRWLLFCINGNSLATLTHINLCRTKSDQELFLHLKEKYRQLRSEVSRMKRWLLQLSQVHFVQFQLLPRMYVGGLVINRLPRAEITEYEYKKVSLIPPVPTEFMLHLYRNPHEGFGHNWCLDRFPKKEREKLEFLHNNEIEGWGIYFTERLNTAMFVTLIFFLTLSTGLVFGICWTVFKHDFSGAWALSAWISSLFALAMSSWMAWATLS